MTEHRNTRLDEVGGNISSASQSSVDVQQSSKDSDELEIRFQLFHLVGSLKHRLEARDTRLLGLLQPQRRAKSVGNFHRLRAHIGTLFIWFGLVG